MTEIIEIKSFNDQGAREWRFKICNNNTVSGDFNDIVNNVHWDYQWGYEIFEFIRDQITSLWIEGAIAKTAYGATYDVISKGQRTTRYFHSHSWDYSRALIDKASNRIGAQIIKYTSFVNSGIRSDQEKINFIKMMDINNTQQGDAPEPAAPAR